MKSPLRHIIFEVTQKCNLSCLYCYNYWRRTDRTVRLTSFKETARTLKRILKTVDFEHITFTGGEPMLADGLKELVLTCRIHNKAVTIITNGVVARSEDYKMLADLGVSLFELPLHGQSAEIHDQLTGVSGSFKKVIESISLLSTLKTEICIAVVLTKLNIERLCQTLQFAQNLGIKRVMLARFNIGGRGIQNIQTLVPSLDALRTAFRCANDFVSQRNVTISANVCVPQCIINPLDYPNIPISLCGSNPTRKPITIDAHGDVRICNHSPRIIGNIHSEYIGTMFNSPYLNAWETACPAYCSGCAYWKQCRGGCRAASEQMGKSVDFEDPLIAIMQNL